MELLQSKKWLPALAVLIIATVPYWQSLSFDYALDDEFFLQNRYVQEGFSGIPDLFSHGYFEGFNGSNDGQYRPIPLTTFAIEAALKLPLPLSHLLNLLLYLACGWLLWKLLDSWIQPGKDWIKLGILALFMLHPVHIEAVASLKNREELLMLFFLLGATRQWTKYLLQPKLRALIFSLGLFFLALLSKEHALSWVAVIPLLAWTFYKKSALNAIKTGLPFLGIAVLYLLIRAMVMDSLAFDRPMDIADNVLVAGEGMGDRLAGVSLVMGHYWRLLAWPVWLSWEYSFNTIPFEGWTQLSVWLGFILSTALLTFAIFGLKKRSPVALGVLWVFLTLGLVSNLFVLMGTTLGERFLLLPSIGFCIAFVFGLAGLGKRFISEEKLLKKASIGLITVIALLFAVRSFQRMPVWKDKMTLFQSGLNSAPNSVKVHLALASEYTLKWERQTNPVLMDSSLIHCERAIEIMPQSSEAWYLKGMALFRKGDRQNAFNAFFESTRLDPGLAQSWNYLGVIAMQVGDLPKAKEYLEKAIAANDRYAKGWVNLGVWYGNQGNETEAGNCFRKALAIDPNNLEAKNNLARSQQP